MALQKDLREFIELLNSNEAEYVIIGAHALAFHGVPRYTGDLDIAVRVSAANAAKLAQAVTEFGFAETGLSEKDFLVPDQIIQLGRPPNRVDILNSLSGITFEELWSGRIRTTLDGVSVNMISKEHLIQNKRAVGRPQDLADVKKLEQLR